MTSSPGSHVARTPKKRNGLAPGAMRTRPGSIWSPRCCREVRGARLAEGRDSGSGAVVRVPVEERLGARFDDVARSREVGLADLEVDDAASLRFELARAGKHLECRLRAEPLKPGCERVAHPDILVRPLWTFHRELRGCRSHKRPVASRAGGMSGTLLRFASRKRPGVPVSRVERRENRLRVQRRDCDYRGGREPGSRPSRTNWRTRRTRSRWRASARSTCASRRSPT